MTAKDIMDMIGWYKTSRGHLPRIQKRGTDLIIPLWGGYLVLTNFTKHGSGEFYFTDTAD